MSIKMIGVVLVVAGCGGVGCSIAAGIRREMKLLQSLLAIISRMECELRYRLTPLPELCRLIAKDTRGVLQEVFLNLARELDWQIAPDAGSCMVTAIQRSSHVPLSVKSLLMELGTSLGRFDLRGQLQELESVRNDCNQTLEGMIKSQEPRLRSYRTLGICAGAATAILLI